MAKNKVVLSATKQSLADGGISGNIHSSLHMLGLIERSLDDLRSNLTGSEEPEQGKPVSNSLLAQSTELSEQLTRCQMKLREIVQSLGYTNQPQEKL